MLVLRLLSDVAGGCCHRWLLMVGFNTFHLIVVYRPKKILAQPQQLSKDRTSRVGSFAGMVFGTVPELLQLFSFFVFNLLFSPFFSFSFLSRGTTVQRTCDQHKNPHISLFLPTIFGSILLWSPVIVVTQIRAHIYNRLSSPVPTTVRAFFFVARRTQLPQISYGST